MEVELFPLGFTCQRYLANKIIRYSRLQAR